VRGPASGRSAGRRRLLAVAAVLGLCAAPGFGQSVELRLGGGWSWIRGGDLASGLQGQSDYLRDQYAATGTFGNPSSGWGGEAEIVLRVLPRFGIGIGGGYFRHLKESSVSYASGSMSVAETVKPDAAVIPITLNLHYALPLASKLRLDIKGGAGYYLATWNWTYRMDLSLLGYAGNETYAFKATRGAVGFQGGLSLDWELAPHFALFMGVTGRYAVVDNFLGSWTDVGDGDFWQFSDSGTDHYAWYYDWTVGSKTYGQLVFQPGQPSGSTTSNARTAKLDLSGVTATFGIRIGFGR
jgi:hypothetical protein